MNKKIILGIILVALVAIGSWYMFLGGQEYIETGILGQDAVAVEITLTHQPVTASPELKNMTVNMSVKCYKTRVSKTIDLKAGPTQKAYHVREISKDIATAHGAQVEFEKTITIYNATGHIVFQRTMTMTKGTDKVISIYSTVEELKPGTNVKIEIKIHMKLTPRGAAPSTIEWTLEQTITTTVKE